MDNVIAYKDYILLCNLEYFKTCCSLRSKAMPPGVVRPVSAMEERQREGLRDEERRTWERQEDRERGREEE